MVVLDHPDVQRVVRIILEREGCRVTEVSAAEALELLASRAPEIDLVITNTLDCVAAVPCGVPVLCLSAAPAEEFRMKCGHRDCHMLRKPFLAHELVRAFHLSLSPIQSAK